MRCFLSSSHKKSVGNYFLFYHSSGLGSHSTIEYITPTPDFLQIYGLYILSNIKKQLKREKRQVK
jgi:hypothetical protein